ncbi:MAG: putative rRNA maturation factor [Candidatus Krumholzibacteriia bacterium]|jgi:probable rRNA maturation factor
MILELVERQSDETAQAVTDDLWSKLKGMAARIGCPHWQVDVVLVSDAAMVELNHQFRHKDGVTDILSFSYLLAEGANSCDCPEGQNFAPHDLWQSPEPEDLGTQPTVGELVLAPAFIANRCLENGWSWATELEMLIVHGCLHLLGWDHQEPAEMATMQGLEAEILEAVGTKHPLRKDL